MKEALTLLLGNPTRRVMTTIPSVIMGSLAWQKRGFFLAIGGLDCLSEQDSILMEIVPWRVLWGAFVRLRGATYTI
jgi:hypothetical protein